MQYTNDVAYACPEELMFTHAEIQDKPICDWCTHKCNTIFLRIFTDGRANKNYCSQLCYDKHVRILEVEEQHKRWLKYAMEE